MLRRPVPVGAEDIGTWQDILQITSVASVVTNAALVVYTMDLTNDFSDVGQLWIFIGFQYTIFVIMAIFAFLVDDMPEEVAIQLGRQQYLQERAAQSEQELRDEDEKIPSGASRPVLTAAEEEECVVSSCTLAVQELCCFGVILHCFFSCVYRFTEQKVQRNFLSFHDVDIFEVTVQCFYYCCCLLCVSCTSFVR